MGVDARPGLEAEERRAPIMKTCPSRGPSWPDSAVMYERGAVGPARPPRTPPLPAWPGPHLALFAPAGEAREGPGRHTQPPGSSVSGLASHERVGFWFRSGRSRSEPREPAPPHAVESRSRNVSSPTQAERAALTRAAESADRGPPEVSRSREDTETRRHQRARHRRQPARACAWGRQTHTRPTHGQRPTSAAALGGPRS